eukprot:13306731-Ditylum_brightwellii.AAC.1
MKRFSRIQNGFVSMMTKESHTLVKSIKDWFVRSCHISTKSHSSVPTANSSLLYKSLSMSGGAMKSSYSKVFLRGKGLLQN